MCTVIIRVEPGSAWPVTLIALRDESPERPWDPPGAWWPDLDPSVQGVHDRSAGGAWLAVSERTRSLAVVLNRWEPVAEPQDGWTTRGSLPLDAVVAGTVPTGSPTTRTFNLVRADAHGATVTAWDGSEVVTTRLGPGVHMLTETAADDPAIPRIARWLDEFRAVEAPVVAPGPDALAGLAAPGTVDTSSSRDPAEDQDAAVDQDPAVDPRPAVGQDLSPLQAAGAAWAPWVDVLRRSAALEPSDPAAIVRDNTGPEGRFATLSVVAAAVGPEGTVLRHVRLEDPAHIDAEGLVRHA
jgi:hypothetical protein